MGDSRYWVNFGCAEDSTNAPLPGDRTDARTGAIAGRSVTSPFRGWDI
jgi:hypothetical protein